jgi:hypothetical protein
MACWSVRVYHTLSVPRTALPLNHHECAPRCPFHIDMDMSYARKVPHPKVLHQCTASYSSHTSHSVSHVLHQLTASHSSYTLHLTLYTLRFTSYVLSLTSYILHLTPYVSRLTSYVLHLTSYILYLISYRIVFCIVWHVYILCVRHIHDPMLLP